MSLGINHIPESQIPFPRIDRRDVELLYSTGHYDGHTSGLCRYLGEICSFEMLCEGATYLEFFAEDDPDEEGDPVGHVDMRHGYYRRFAIHPMTSEERERALARCVLWAELVGDHCTFGPPDSEGCQRRLQSDYKGEVGAKEFYARTAGLPH